MSLTTLQAAVSNRLDLDAARGKTVAGIVGDAPSQYAKSPSIWNPTFAALGMPAVYLPFDVAAGKLPAVVAALRDTAELVGFNVTVPYKIDIVPLLDALDPRAKRIGAVNTVVRGGDGRLTGYNTDGQGFIDSLVRMPAADGAPLLKSLDGARVLLLGAGGAARACAHFLVDEIGGGRVVIANRDAGAARALAAELNAVRAGVASAVGEEGIATAAAASTLVVNATVKGQAGLRKLAGGRITCLEPYSSLAPAAPASLPDAGDARAFYHAWFRESAKDVDENVRRSAEIMQGLGREVGVCDIVYAPLETVLLRQARLAGHRTVNGKGMNIGQAATGFARLVCRGWLEQRGMEIDTNYATVLETMTRVW